MSMIRTARGSWHKPFYHIEKLDDFYENERKPIGYASAKIFVQESKLNAAKVTNPVSRYFWTSSFGYVLADRWQGYHLNLLAGAALVKSGSSSKQLEELRQEMLHNEKWADVLTKEEGSPLRVDSKRIMIHYFKTLSGRFTSSNSQPILTTGYFANDALATLAAAELWAGPSYEVATELVFRDLNESYSSINMLSKLAAAVSSIGSLISDQFEEKKMALIPMYLQSGGNLNEDLRSLHTFITSCNGPQATMIGHYVAIANQWPSGNMLAALRHGCVSLRAMNFPDAWLRDARWIAERIELPFECLECTKNVPISGREARIHAVIADLWVHIDAANAQGPGTPDAVILIAQRVLHIFVDTEVQLICWRMSDPAVLWSVCAALFLNFVNIPEMASMLFLVDQFKYLLARSELIDENWLSEIYKMKESGKKKKKGGK